jgi:glycosidase
MDSYYFSRTRGVPELPLRAQAQTRYGFPDDARAEQGQLRVADYSAAQRLAETINRTREVDRFPESAVRAGELYAAALVQELLRLIVANYLRATDPDALTRAYTQLETQLGRTEFERTLAHYVAAFPPKLVSQGEVAPDMYLTGEHVTRENRSVPNRQVALEGLLLLHFANLNPALERLKDLFDDAELSETRYPEVMTGLEGFFAGEPDAGEAGQKLFALLRAPIDASPTSLEGQLAHLRARLGALALAIPGLDELLSDILRAGDTLREELKPTFGGGPGPAPVLDPAAAYRAGRGPGSFVPDEYEAFSQDSSWMPRVVMLAKSTFVWLGQLSKQYGREISRLDEIPDEELDELARRGFTGLWLIGLWERSKASKTIKNLRGNPDAVASAYSLYDYVIAEDLGGAEAFETLKRRAWERGIRMASDMVPNHVGVDGRWVVEHPNWFLQLDHPPYPSYTFNGPDLSQDDRVGIFLEDHYYDSSDAAVVFKRQDRHTGDATYIYHGNDGTSMPWNDTAQIDYLNPEAREAVIQTILHVARLSPIIRFDAAMTLAKQHVQRLWYPEPGSGGAIASRAQHGSMTTEDFERAIPQEFWREVVDRVAQEVPDTLLLAEAFWMMEGYFVRTLGMHRVYNSAFMHMFKNEDNAKYRLSIKNVLEFEPEILKRFVNFMNNPDEETAVAQFGKDDKYFGVAVVMATMPGLPMFGHGQVEGYTEKYGMEYRRAKLNESPDTWLIDRHHREVFPLLHRRYQFAEVENFQLYDVHTDHGIDEDVFAYSNLVDGQASLVTFNNKFGHAGGWIREATPQAGKAQRTLLTGLGLRAGERDFVSFRDQMSGLTFLRRSRDLQGGLALSLDAYKYQVFVDFAEVEDTDGRYEKLHDALSGRGVYDLEAELAGAQLGPVHSAFGQVVSAEVIRTLRGERGARQQERLQNDLPEQLAAFVEVAGGSRGALAAFGERLTHLVALPSLETLAPESPQREAMEQELTTKLSDAGSGTLYVALVLDSLQEARVEISELRLEPLIHEAFAGAGLPDAEHARLLSELLRRYGPRYAEGTETLLTRFKEDAEVQRFVGYDAEADTFDPERYREATVRPLAYALLRAPAEIRKETPDALAVTMAGLSAAEARAAGRWTELEPALEVPPKRTGAAAPKEKGRKTAPAERGSKSKAAGSAKQSAKKRAETPKKTKSAKTAPKKKPAPKG